MIQVYINQQLRQDVAIVTGGSLEESSAHATSSAVSIQVPVESDDIKECDYLQLFDNGENVFSGIILKKSQQTFDRPLNWRIYDLEMAGNSDLVSTVFVDLAFPAGSSIQQILFGNHSTQSWYRASSPEFPGIFEERIARENISLGTVDDFSSFILSDPAYLWGRYVSDVLNDMADIASAWWEITPDRVFNMRFSSNRDIHPVPLDENSEVFNLSVSKDTLTYYSACRVVGGTGTSRTLNVTVESDAQAHTVTSIWREDEATLTSQSPLRSAISISQLEDGHAPSDPTMLGTIQVGYKGLHDDDPNYQALMTSGGNSIELKDGYQFLPLSDTNRITVQGVVFEIDVYARIVDPGLTKQIAAQRGGSGIIEYTMEDDSIQDFGTAVETAQTFLANHAQPVAEISFSCFYRVPVGKLVTVNLPYYGIFGNYQVTKLVATTVLDRDDQSVLQYDITLSNETYRDPYKELWYTPTTTTFALDSGQAAEDGLYIDNKINVKSYITAYASEITTWSLIQTRAASWETFEEIYPSWQMLQSSSNPYPWSAIQQRFSSWKIFEGIVISWAWLEQIQLEWYYLGNYLTAYGKKQILNYLSGENPAVSTDLWGDILVADANGGTEKFSPEDVSMTNNGGTATYVLLPSDAMYQIGKIIVPEGNVENGSPILSADVDIDHRSDNPRGQFSLTIAVRTTIE
ncbi:hypothetical protein NIF40_06485 [[Clostridium] leptum]|nr:hypothetical protein [[Clostridium] leptum]